MKKILILITTVLAICTAGLTGCNTDKTNGDNPVPENTRQIIQDEQSERDCKDDDCENPDCQDDINEVPVPPRHIHGRHRDPRRGHGRTPEPKPMPRQLG